MICQKSFASEIYDSNKIFKISKEVSDMAKDPVCGMGVNVQTAQNKYEYKEKCTTSALPCAW